MTMEKIERQKAIVAAVKTKLLKILPLQVETYYRNNCTPSHMKINSELLG